MRKIIEKLELVNYDNYVDLVSDAYSQAPSYEEESAKHWYKLAESNDTLFKRLLSKVNIIFTTENESELGKRDNAITIAGKRFDLILHPDPYESAEQMKQDYQETGSLKISIDYSNHPIFSVEQNITFRCVHDFIVHILGNHPFGAKGEIASYNRHAKIAPPEALPALFTEIVGQACYYVINGEFPEQKIALLLDFDFTKVGYIKGYDVVNKELVKSE